MMLGVSGCMQVCALPPHNVTQPNKDTIILATADPAASQPDTQTAVTAAPKGQLAYKTHGTKHFASLGLSTLNLKLQLMASFYF